jgi:hypothetical protein
VDPDRALTESVVAEAFDAPEFPRPWTSILEDSTDAPDDAHLCARCGCIIDDPLEECPVCAIELDAEAESLP